MGKVLLRKGVLNAKMRRLAKAVEIMPLPVDERDLARVEAQENNNDKEALLRQRRWRRYNAPNWEPLGPDDLHLGFGPPGAPSTS